MKILLFILLVTVGHAAADSKPLGTTLSLKNGKVFRNVKITSETDDAIYVRYNAGMVKILKSELSAEMQKQFPTSEQRANAEAEQRKKEAARVDEEKAKEAAESLSRIKREHSKLVSRITKPSLAERELSAVGQPVVWRLSFDDLGQNLLFVSAKTTSPDAQETRFVFEVPEREFHSMVSLINKFEEWCSICSKESPKPTVEKVIGTLGSIECLFRYNRQGGGTLWIGNDAIQEEDARHFLALSTSLQELTAESREIQAKNISVAERLK